MTVQTGEVTTVRVPSVAGAAFPASALRRASHYVALAKPRVVLMILLTTGVAYHTASSGISSYRVLLSTLLGTALAAAGALSLNQYVEREIDGRMDRTRERPLPKGRLRPIEALVFGALATCAGVAYLMIAATPLAACVTLLTALLYVCVYTPLKPRTALAPLIGAIPGALPILTGWSAACGRLDLGCVVLFALLFLWQIPHTLAIARLHQNDYARAGILVLPVVDPLGRTTERQIIVGCLALCAASLLPTLIGLEGTLYFFGALALGAGFLICGVAHARAPCRTSARRVVLGSVIYLPLILVLLAIDKIGRL
jgi:protoheme IX farnesyltransferase